ncbi:MAG: hypothetical protein JWN93_3045 [Hyphomicrobiales bacterium]|nr:hypothetical protein [Hyphomicrobiales bacterium]
MLLRHVALPVVALALACFGVWGALALFFRAGGWQEGRVVLAAAFGLVTLAAVRGVLTLRWREIAPALVLFPLVFLWWEGIAPSNHRDWVADVSRLPTVRLDGERAVVENVRNFKWTSDTQADPHWETRAYDLDALESVDLLASYWAGETIAHTFLSFGFSDGRRLAWSAELRRSAGQTYKTLESLFKLSELIIVAGDERDVIGVRANAREEDVRLYRLRLPKEMARKLFLSYAQEANELAERPRWYNTLTNNCTTTIFELARMLDPGAHYDWRVLLPGHFPQYAYDRGALDASAPFEVLQARSHISGLAKAADFSSSVAFSQGIRVSR